MRPHARAAARSIFPASPCPSSIRIIRRLIPRLTPRLTPEGTVSRKFLTAHLWDADPDHLVHLSYRTRLTKNRERFLRMLKLRTLAGVLLALAVSAAPLALAQQPPSQPSTPQSAPAQPGAADQQTDDSQQPAETLKVNVNVVSLFFNVKDKHGALIPNLTKDDFTVAEDSKPQIIKDKDEAFVIDFNIDAELVQDYTRDVHRLQAALNKVKINSGVTMPTLPGAGGGPVPTAHSAGTVLYDAVYLSAHDMLAKEVGRKAMILLTDGEDEGSQLKIKDAIEAAQKSDAIVYVLLCADRGFYGMQGGFYSGEGEMRKLTEQTGGRVINVGNKFDKLREAFDQIAAELRSQYNIG